jgi:hypothetical protein
VRPRIRQCGQPTAISSNSTSCKVLPAQRVDATPSEVKVVFMRQGRRYGLSAAQRTDIWRRWKAGESLHEIGRALGKDHGSIQFLLSQHGGIAPAIRHRRKADISDAVEIVNDP